MKRFLVAMSVLALASMAGAVSQDRVDDSGDQVDLTTVVSQTQSGRLQADSSGRPGTVMDGTKVLAKFVYDQQGRLSEISTNGGARLFQYSDNTLRPTSAWISKAGSAQPWRAPNGLTEANILDTIAAFNQAPMQTLKRVNALIETTMLSALSAEMRQMYRSFGAQKALTDFDLLLCETPFSCFACLALCNTVGRSRRADCAVYQDVPGQEGAYIDCMNDAARIELACGFTCL